MEVRQARVADVPGMAALVARFAGRGEILPRNTEDIYTTLREWVVATDETGQIVGDPHSQVFRPPHAEGFDYLGHAQDGSPPVVAQKIPVLSRPRIILHS